MTNLQLERGREIQNEIERLKGALSELLRGQIFDCRDSGCHVNRIANPFLAELEVKTRKSASDAITAKIKDLEREFKSL